jgi:hypothetical protein
MYDLPVGALRSRPHDRRDETSYNGIMARAKDRFDIQVVRDGAGYKVRVKFRGRVVRTVTGADAELIADAAAAGDDDALQLLVARKTGNFKRGNER